jgi:hypothetical protein
MSYKLSDSGDRASFFTWISSLGSHWQENPTPFEIIRKMVSKTSLNDKHILVLFNIEFLHILIDEQGVNPQEITFIADNQIEKLCANKIFKVQSYCLSDYTVPALNKLIAGINMKFDLVFSNPPYNRGSDIKIINEILDYIDEIIVVHPSTWVLDSKGKTKSYADLKNNCNTHTKSLDLFNGNIIFDIQLFVPCIITHIDKNFVGQCEVNYFDSNYKVESLEDVTKFGDKWSTLVKPFQISIKKWCLENTNVWQHNMNEIDEKLFNCQISSIRGTPNRSKNSTKMVLDDFYTLILKNPDDCKGIRIKDIHKPGNIIPIFGFLSENERDNFVKYLCTDFARFCLALLKNNPATSLGEMELIPWLDFTEAWDDDKLFKKFNVSKELQGYIKEFLPDFHGIRK